MSDRALTDSDSFLKQELTCSVSLDEQLIECFHVYCKNCCNQLTVHKEEDGEHILQCATCQTREVYPPRVTSGGQESLPQHTGTGLASLAEICQNLSCELISTITKKTTACKVVRKTEQRLFEVSYKPTTRGKHHLCVRLDGEHIRGSPFTVVVRLPVETLGRPMMILDSLCRPWGLVVTCNGDIIVAEHDAHQVSTCSTAGGHKLFASCNAERRVFEDPRGIAVDIQGSVYIVDGKLCCVQKFTSDGEFITKVGKHGRQPLEFSSPVGIAVHPQSQKMYVADNGNHRIQVLESDLTFSHVFGKHGSSDGELNFPWDVAVDSAGKVYVADSWNNRIQVFTEDGQHLRQFGQKGEANGALSWPSSIWIDVEDFVYVTEAQNHCVSVFHLEGAFLTSFGSKGTGYGQFIEPTGITVDRYRVVYVSDSGNNRLQLF